MSREDEQPVKKEALIQLQNVSKVIGGRTIINSLSFDIYHGGGNDTFIFSYHA
jgi:ABC-type molybdenum transport system ATPase subunit/photorepair protein PhrA